MPAWLVTLLVKLITPIVESIIDKLMVSARLSAIEKDAQAFKDGFKQLSEATDTHGIQAAANKISRTWNRT